MTATTTHLAEMTLSGSIEQMLEDNAHVKDLDAITDADPDADLHRAIARYLITARSTRMGRGWQYRGDITAEDAELILNYVTGVADALSGDGDPEAKAEARTYRRGLATAIVSLQNSGMRVEAHYEHKFLLAYRVTNSEG